MPLVAAPLFWCIILGFCLAGAMDGARAQTATEVRRVRSVIRETVERHVRAGATESPLSSPKWWAWAAVSGWRQVRRAMQGPRKGSKAIGHRGGPVRRILAATLAGAVVGARAGRAAHRDRRQARKTARQAGTRPPRQGRTRRVPAGVCENCGGVVNRDALTPVQVNHERWLVCPVCLPLMADPAQGHPQTQHATSQVDQNETVDEAAERHDRDMYGDPESEGEWATPGYDPATDPTKARLDPAPAAEAEPTGPARLGRPYVSRNAAAHARESQAEAAARMAEEGHQPIRYDQLEVGDLLAHNPAGACSGSPHPECEGQPWQVIRTEEDEDGQFIATVRHPCGAIHAPNYFEHSCPVALLPGSALDGLAAGTGLGPLNEAQDKRDRDGLGHICAADGRPETSEDDLVIAADGYRIHRSDRSDPTSGDYDLARDAYAERSICTGCGTGLARSRASGLWEATNGTSLKGLCPDGEKHDPASPAQLNGVWKDAKPAPQPQQDGAKPMSNKQIQPLGQRGGGLRTRNGSGNPAAAAGDTINHGQLLAAGKVLHNAITVIPEATEGIHAALDTAQVPAAAFQRRQVTEFADRANALARHVQEAMAAIDKDAGPIIEAYNAAGGIENNPRPSYLAEFGSAS